MSKKNAKGGRPPQSVPVEEKKPISKGHRQRGAGTVITAKPSIVTQDGITMKPHEKLPFQLLHEYCQRNKRPNPKYNRAPLTAADRREGGETYRTRVVLEDPKNAKNNMSFCPVQAFTSEAVAKDFAALLALFHLQKTLPLERLLPPPYNSTWLQLVCGNSDSLSNAKDEEMGDDNSATTSMTAETTTTVIIDEQEADWLCSQCGTPNTYWTLAKNVRKKCFKCQTVKDEGAIAVGCTSSTKVAGSNGKMGGAKPEGGKVVKKIPPQAILNLQSVEQFVSAAEKEQYVLQAKSMKNSILSYSDALWSTNPLYALGGISNAMIEKIGLLLRVPLSSTSIRTVASDSMAAANEAKVDYALSTFESNVERLLNSYGWQISDKAGLHCLIDNVEKLSSNSTIFRFIKPDEEQYLSLVALVGHIFIIHSVTEDGVVRKGLEDNLTLFLSDTDIVSKRDPQTVEEEESMAAIYGAESLTVLHRDYENSFFHNLSLQYDGIVLHIVYSSSLPYPRHLPLLYLTRNGNSSHPINILAQLHNLLYSKLYSWSPDSLILFDLNSYLSETLCGRLFQPKSCHIDFERVQSAAASLYARLDIPFNPHEQSSPTSCKVETTTISNQEASIRTIVVSKDDNSRRHVVKRMKAKNVKSPHPFWMPLKDNSPYDSHFPTATAQYQLMLQQRQKLPAHRKRELFLDLIQSKQCVIVTGETGCGKTTQIPQFLVEARGQCKVLVCQPRRLAAIGVAQRIAEETSTSIGEQVGYMVKGEVRASKKTMILFCTYGVLLRVLQDDSELRAVDYIILDEVHERGMDSDFALALLMHALQSRGSSLKLILMSATISTDQFQSYLCSHLYKDAVPSEVVPIMHIEGFTYPVQDFYKNDYEEYVRSVSLSRPNEEIIFPKKVKDVDFELMVRLVMTLLHNPDQKSEAMYETAKGCILIFLPGISEIHRLIQYLSSYFTPSASISRIVLLPLHSNLSPSEQAKVFTQYRDPSIVKIICATNIAEASVTIPDVTVVIDSCKVKAMYFDANTQSNTLLTGMAGRFNLVQRKGRAGRVTAGRCYKLITQYTYENIIQQQMPPEIMRISLDSIVLQCYAMREVFQQQQGKKQEREFTAADILSKCIDCPAKDSISLTERKLALLQAIDLDEARLTHLGNWLSNLACSPQIGRLLVFGVILQCVSDACLVASVITCKPPFVNYNPNSDNEEDRKSKEKIANTMEAFGNVEGKLLSDFEMLLRITISFLKAPQPRKFCQQHGLAFERMTDIISAKDDFLKDLQDSGLIDRSRSSADTYSISSGPSPVLEEQRVKVVNAVIAAGLFPNVAYVIRPPKRFIEVIGGKVEKDMTAEEMKFFIPTYDSSSSADSIAIEGSDNSIDKDLQILCGDRLSSPMQRVYLPNYTLNASNSKYEASSYLVYAETFRSASSRNLQTHISLQMTSEVMPIALILFAWTNKSYYEEEKETLYVNDFIRFSCSYEVYAMLRAVQETMEELLFVSPEELQEDSISAKRRDLLQVVLSLIVAEGISFKREKG